MIDITDKEFKRLANYVENNYGVHLKQEKRALVIGRLQNLLVKGNYKSFSEYCDHIDGDKTGNASRILANKITTNHTFFMREIEHFKYYEDYVLPYLALVQKNKKDLRIWSAGCSSGEEPYTLAMINSDYFAKQEGSWDSTILATDISRDALEKAVKGIYLNEKLEVLPQNWKRDYLERIDNEKSIIKEKIKKEIIYRNFNLMNDNFPFKKKFHVIFCRNVMIYFDTKTKKRLIDKFYDSTEYGGYLFIGQSESLNKDETKYKYIMPAVYRKE